MTPSHARLEPFYRELQNISSGFESVDKKRDELKEMIYAFEQKTQNIKVDKDFISKNEELGNEIEAVLEKQKEVIADWVMNFNEMLQREEFRSELKEHFIVIIFGKVKAGKSSLGNFIARNNTLEQKAAFFRYDEAGKREEIKKLEEIDEDSFETNNLECTVSIQGFKLNGLAWIDTPGLGSMTPQNGKLAQEYIEAADYIIYPTSSSHPLQRDEIEQLKELINQNKKITVCITKSDTTERRKKEGGGFVRDANGEIAKFIINKTSQNRESQESYVKNEIKEIAQNQTALKLAELFSISALTAQIGLDKNNEELFLDSNIPLFYDSITDVIKHAKEIKKSVPYENLISFIENSLLGKNSAELGINVLKNHIDNLGKTIADTKRKFELLKQNANSDISMEIEMVVEEFSGKIDKHNAAAIFKEIDEILSENISKKVEESILEILKDFTFSLNEMEKNKKSGDAFEIKDIIRTVTTRYETSSVLRKIASSFGLVERTYETLREDVNFGDNKHKVILDFKQNRQELFASLANKNYDFIVNDFLTPLDNLFNQMKQNIVELESNLVGLTLELNKIKMEKTK